MAFRVIFTGDKEWPIVFDDGIMIEFTGKAKGFRISKCSATTEKVYNSRNISIEAYNGFWLDASQAITDKDGIVHFS
jgi:hypothetical protein